MVESNMFLFSILIIYILGDLKKGVYSIAMSVYQEGQEVFSKINQYRSPVNVSSTSTR